MLTVKEVGERLGKASGRAAFGRSSVAKYIHQGLLQAQKLGNMYVIEEAEFERFLKEVFAGRKLRGGRPRTKPLPVTCKRSHGNAGKKYQKRGQTDAS